MGFLEIIVIIAFGSACLIAASFVKIENGGEGPAGEVDGNWVTKDFRSNQGGTTNMVALPFGRDITVAGTSFHIKSCKSFLKKADRYTAYLSHKRTTYRGEYAIVVYGHTSASAAGQLLGHVPREVTEELSETFSVDMPIALKLRRAGKHRTDPAIFVAFDLQGPRKADRAKFEL